MSPVSACCFLLAGTALALSNNWRRTGQIAIGGALMAVALSALWLATSQNELAMNQPLRTGWLVNPGSLSIPLNLSLGFALAGLALLLTHLWQRSLVTDLLPALGLAIALIGLTTAIEYLFTSELPREPSMYPHMALHSAAGLLVLATGLWFNAGRIWSGAGNRPDDNEERHILLTGSGILVVIALISGVASFLMLERQTSAMYRRTLDLTLRNRLDVYNTTINQGVTNTLAIATRPAIRRELQRLRERADDREALTFLQTAVGSFLDLGFNAISLHTPAGRTVVSAGRFADKPGLRLPLSLAHRTDLLWQDGPILRIEVRMIEARRHIGTVIAEWPAMLLGRLLLDIRGIGETGEMVVCGARADQMACLPTRLHARPFVVARAINGQPLPLSRALNGETGLIKANDYRHKSVLAAYGPVGDTGLGMVIKMDSQELYEPIYQQMQRALLLLVVLVAAGLLLLRWRMLPLVQRLVESRIVLRAANTELRDSEARIRAVIEGTTDAVYIKDTEGRYLLINSAGARALGRHVEDVLGRTDRELFPVNSAHLVQDHDRLAMESGQALTHEDIVEVAGGRRVYLSNRAPYRDADGHIIGLVGISRDITERKRSEEEARSQSLTDELTGLYNRRGLLTLATPLLEREARAERGLFLFFADLDGLKAINDEFGHSEGDQAIRDTAQLLRQTFRDSDIISRFGGDEFVVLAPDTRPEDAQAIQLRLQERIAGHNRNAGRSFRLAVTVGVVRYDSRHTPNIESLLARGDEEMYRLKKDRRQ